MKAFLNQLNKAYFSSAWLPSAFVLLVFGFLLINDLKLHIPYIDYGLLSGLVAGLLGILGSAIFQFTRGRKLVGVINIIAFPLVGYIIALGIGYLAMASFFDDTPDNFGKDIVIPTGMKISDPVDDFAEPGGPAVDELTEKVIAAFSANSPADTTAKISTDLAVLDEFGTTNRQKLIEHLAASPQWFVTEENGKAYACRKFAVNGRWQNSLNGFFSGVFVSVGDFQTRIVIGFDGPVFAKSFDRKGVLTTARIGDGRISVHVRDDKEFHQGKESYLVLQSSKAAIEIFEQSKIDARPITQMALADLKRELESALENNNVTTSSNSAGFHAHVPEIQVAKGMQGGIYEVRAFVNPGEAGRAYIKVFEATKNTPLSADQIKPRSISRIGWSANSNETFRYQSEITVYEGDWGNFYPGRFELWFIPDSGGAERKLIDRIFRIDGWMR